MPTKTMPVDLARGAKFRAAAQHNDPYATYRRLDRKFENLREKYGVDPRITPGMLRQAAAALYRWDPHPDNQTSDVDRAERTIEAGSWERAVIYGRAVDTHVDNLRTITVAAAQDRAGNEGIPSAINDCQIAAKALNEAWVAVRGGDLKTARKLRLETARYLSMVAGLLQGHGLDRA